MRQGDLARVLLVQACEESDAEGRFVPHRDRDRAAQVARERAGGQEPEPFLSLRAKLLAAPLEARSAGLRAALRLAGLAIPPVIVGGAALLLGLGLDRLGPTRRINLLAFPLLGLLLWNLAVYAALLAGAARPRSRRRRPRLGVAGTLARAAVWLVSSDRPWMRSGPAEEARWTAAVLRRFLALWLSSAGALLVARTRGLLHLGAAAFAAGAVLGMYVRGLAFEYRASWESTFLGTQEVHRLLSAVLGPAARLLEALAPGLTPSPLELLSPESLARLRGPAGDGEAALWIHLWALTMLLAVLVPRAALGWAARRGARRLAGDLHPPLEDPYFMRLLAAGRGAGVRADVVPYSYRPAKRVQDGLGALLLDLFGNRAHVDFHEPVAYGGAALVPDGTEAGRLRDGTEAGRVPAGALCVVTLFNLAQPPEQEVHAHFLEALKREIERRGGGASLLVVLDEEPYRARLGAAEGRLLERRRAWERLARECHLSAVTLGTGAGGPDAALAGLRAALWPDNRGEAA